jgi:tetratricopeptide (TPR) repeat protein
MKKHPIVILLLFIILLYPVCGIAADDPDQLFEQAVAEFNSGEYDKAISLWERALPLYKEGGDTEHEGMILNNIGLVRFYLHEYDESVAYFKDALAIDRKRGISKDIATDLQNLGMAYSALREYGQALSAFKEAAEIADSVGDIEARANNLYRIAITHVSMGTYAEAGGYFIAASDLHRGIRDRSGYALDLMGLGDVYAALGRFDKALENYEEALKVREVLGELEPYVSTRIKIARAYGNNGRYDEALEYLRQAKKDAKEAKEGEGDALASEIASAWGDVLNWSGDAEGALASFEEALALMKKRNDFSGAGMILTNQGILLSELLRFPEAKESFEDARLIYQVGKDPRNEAKVLINLGNLANVTGDFDGALALYSEADRLLVGEKEGAVSGVNYLGFGETYLKKGEFKKARTSFEKAGVLLADERDKRYTAKIDAYIGVLDYYEGNYVSSVARFNDALTILRKEEARTLVADILVGNGMALVAANRPEVASGYFIEAKRLADDLSIAPVGWRAVYGDGVIRERGGDTAMAGARYEDALFRFSGMPDATPTLYGARIVKTDDLLDKLSKTRVDAGTGTFDRTGLNEGLNGITGLLIGLTEPATAGEEVIIGKMRNAVGEANYLAKRLADDEYRKGNNTDIFTRKLLSVQGEYLKLVDEVRKDEPGLWEKYFKALYE